jgi:hypothetical protein
MFNVRFSCRALPSLAAVAVLSLLACEPKLSELDTDEEIPIGIIDAEGDAVLAHSRFQDRTSDGREISDIELKHVAGNEYALVRRTRSKDGSCAGSQYIRGLVRRNGAIFLRRGGGLFGMAECRGCNPFDDPSPDPNCCGSSDCDALLPPGGGVDCVCAGLGSGSFCNKIQTPGLSLSGLLRLP